MDKNINVIYNKLENIKLNQGFVNLNNSCIQSKNDLVDICNIFRDPRYETFRVFYMKDNIIVGQEAITSKIPDGVIIFNEKTGEPIRTYEKMSNRMKRLNANGYYLAHNHPSGIAKASKEDMEITKNFAANVDGFLGHIIIGDANRYSIIEEDKDERILIPNEQILSNDVFNILEEKYADNNSFFNIKISCRDELIALFIKMQNSKEYSTAVLTDTHNNIRMIVDIPNKMLNQSKDNLNGFFKNLGRQHGANKVFIGTHEMKTYFKIIEHFKYGTFKDMVFIDNDRVITEKIKESPNLFDKEKRNKSRKNRDVR